MKLFQLLEDSAKYASMNVHQLTDLVVKTIENDQQSQFKTDVKFNGPDTATITVGYVDSKRGQEEQLQNTSKKLNKIIDPLYREFRQAGITFTQPKGVKGSMQETDTQEIGKLEFQIAKANG